MLGDRAELGGADRGEVLRVREQDAQLSPSHSWKLMVPSVDSCVKSGAMLPI